MVGADITLRISRNVEQTPRGLFGSQRTLCLLPGFPKLDGVALCREAQQILTGKGKESRSIEAMDLSRELFGESA